MTKEIKPRVAIDYDMYRVALTNNDELRKFVNRCVEESGLSKRQIAKRLEMQLTTLRRKLNKAQFTLDDANLILDAINPRLGVCAAVSWNRDKWVKEDKDGR